MWKKYIVTFFMWLFILWLFFRLPFMYCIYNISFIGRDVRKSNIRFIEMSCPPMKRQTLICISDFWQLTLIILIYCLNKYLQCQYKHEWQIKVKKLHIFHCFYKFSLFVFIRICVLHTALVLFGCISPDMCIAYTLVLSSLVIFIYKLYKVLFMMITKI
jgi:hypothetical protein